MKIDERFGIHIPIKALWEVRTKVRALTDDEAAHFLGCDRCIIIWGICQSSKSLKQAEERLKEEKLT